ncbi:YqaJ viral recombinase family protein [Defluviimonas salinarum]|uniref:YqaJ viral recombinase family protein n=1 Tax=Defluviimonas salinarum TaxID=2992147 RepID=A0ABT3J4I0_9RHOB|nr:YqaJ viral recombinase family protein [Defluviimonas salinarum]MCW3782594.1 YqaJ viral recombinase family protein [Defluviimonas salinarum]
MTTPATPVSDAAPAAPAAEKAPAFPLAEALVLFRAFDAAADAEAAATPPADFAESRLRLAALIGALPQRAAIKDENVDRWLERTMRMAIGRMELEHGEGKATVADVHRHVLWHVRRASGIGGSEAGTVLKHFRGKRGTFGDAHNLVLEKLLILSPQPSTEEMARGVRAEPVLQQMYLAATGARTDKEALARLKGFRWDKRPASIGTPDDIVVMPDGVRRCVDYKCPSADVISEYEKTGVSEDYVCQLHHYGILAMAAGAKFDVMSVECFDARSFKIMSFPVAFDIDLAKELASSCHRIWHEFVMMGVVPDAPRPDTLALEDEAIVQFGVEAAMLKILGSEIEARQNDLISRIAVAGAEWHELATGKMDLKMASFDRLRKWDDGILKDIAEAAEVDLAGFMVDAKGLDTEVAERFLRDLHDGLAQGEDVGGLLADYLAAGVPVARKLEAEKLADHLEEIGISTLPAAKVQERFLLTRKKKGPEYERLVEAKTEIAQLVDGIEDMVREHAPRIILGERSPEEDTYEPEIA